MKTLLSDLQLGAYIKKQENDTLMWSVSNFSAYKSLGQDGIFPTILQSGLEVITGLVIINLEPVLFFDIFHCPGVWSQLFLYLTTAVMFM